jgi:acyl-CoA thioesterase-2
MIPGMADRADGVTGTLRELLDLESHGPDTFVGNGLEYPWGGLYGGHIVAQALAAAARTVDDELTVHSLRAYFIRRGDHTEPVRQEVDRIRNGRSFATRRVVARQAVGAILNLEASFQRTEPSVDVQTIAAPAMPHPDQLASSTWSSLFDRRAIPDDALPPAAVRSGHRASWLRVHEDLEAPAGSLLQQTAFAYLSDELPTESVLRAHPKWPEWEGQSTGLFTASLDHTIWFHRPMRADRWHLHDFACHSFVGGRGLTVGHVFDLDGVHVATIAQEVLIRER